MPSVIESGFGSSMGPDPTTGPCRARSALRVYDDVPPVAAHLPSTVIVSSAVPVHAAGSVSPVPGNTGAGVVVVGGLSGPPEPTCTADPLDRAGGEPSSASPTAVAEPDPDPDPEAAAPAPLAGVDDEAGLSPVIWISPQTTATEHTSAATMITVTQRVLRVFRLAIRPVCPPPVRPSVVRVAIAIFPRTGGPAADI